MSRWRRRMAALAIAVLPVGGVIAGHTFHDVHDAKGQQVRYACTQGSEEDGRLIDCKDHTPLVYNGDRGQEGWWHCLPRDPWCKPLR